MLILEGTDLVGKTSLQTALLASPPFQARGYTPDHFGPLPIDFNYYHGYVQRASRRVVMDRFHMSEIAYGSAIRKRPNIDVETYRLVDGYLRRLGTYTIVIVCETGLLRERYEQREESLTLEEVISVNTRFEAILRGDTSYAPDYDYVVRCTKDRPFISVDEVLCVVEGYFGRQLHLDACMRNHEYDGLRFGRDE